MKNMRAGFYLSILALIAGIVGIFQYMVNTGTDYFKSSGTNSMIYVFAIAGIACLLLRVVLEKKGQSVVSDILGAIAPVPFILAFATLLSDRVNAIAAIMTFTNNAQNMADLSSALVAIGALLAAALLGMITSFCRIAKAD